MQHSHFGRCAWVCVGSIVPPPLLKKEQITDSLWMYALYLADYNSNDSLELNEGKAATKRDTERCSCVSRSAYQGLR